MPIDFQCPVCKGGLRIKDEHAGKKIKCPKCADVITVPHQSASEAIVDVDVVESPPTQAGADPFTFNDLDRPQAKKAKAEAKAQRTAGQGTWMPCPHCGQREAKKVNWTWWGSFYGPRLFHVVRCVECGGNYNGKTGDTNLIPAILFVSIPLVLIGILLFVIYVMLKQKGFL